jgi:hypothetical protein
MIDTQPSLCYSLSTVLGKAMVIFGYNNLYKLVPGEM